MDYATRAAIARQYDTYHANNPVAAAEGVVLREEFNEPGVVADLGCGSGRVLLPLLQAGHRGLAVDLSQEMLEVVRAKADAAGLTVECLRANLVELDAVADASVDYAVCLFSTLGMIRGRENRRRALGHMHRILRPKGKLVLHAHNFWFNLRDGGGPWWVMRSMIRGTASQAVEVGDKWFPYRGVPNFFLHVFRKRELRADLRAAGLEPVRWVAIDGPALRKAWWLPWPRTIGWLVVCQALP